MSLPAQITNEAGWPDGKNVLIGPFEYPGWLVPIAHTLTNTAPFYTWWLFGDDATRIMRAQSFTPTTATSVVAADVHLGKFGTPTDGLYAEIRSDDGSAAPSGTVLVTSATIAAADFAAIAWLRFNFTGLPLTAGTRYWLVIRRTGGVDVVNYYAWHANASGSDTYPTGRPSTYNATAGIWVDDGIADTGGGDRECRILSSETATAYYAAVINKTDNALRMLRSSDGGSTWVEQDGGVHRPVVVSGTGLKTFDVRKAGNYLYTFISHSTTQFRTDRFHMDKGLWDEEDSATFITLSPSPSVSGSAMHVHSYRADGLNTNAVKAAQLPTESVMGSAYRRCKLHRGAVSAVPVDIISGTTANNGNQVHYDLRAAIMDAADRMHIWWTQSDLVQVMYRVYRADNSFGAIINPASAACSNSEAYPIGQPCLFTQSGTAKVAIPYKNNADGTLYLLRCAAASTETAGNWTAEQVVPVVVESANSNPAVVFGEGGTSARLWAWFVTDDGQDIYYSHDSGAGAWQPETPWKDGTAFTVGGISAAALTDRIGVLYLDTSTTPARVMYDQLAVFRAKADASVGTTEKMIDLGPNFTGSLYVEVECGDAITGEVTLEVEDATNPDTGPWRHQGTAIITPGTGGSGGLGVIDARRYVLATVNVATATSPAGVAGI